MYAIVKTGGKQYKAAPGDKIEVEKIDLEVGSKLELPCICVVDGAHVEADPAVAAKTQVQATIIEQFKGPKQLVFKFKKRKNYKKLAGHRQCLTRLYIDSVGAETAPAWVFSQAASEEEAFEEEIAIEEQAVLPESVSEEAAQVEEISDKAEEAVEEAASAAPQPLKETSEEVAKADEQETAE